MTNLTEVKVWRTMCRAYPMSHSEECADAAIAALEKALERAEAERDALRDHEVGNLLGYFLEFGWDEIGETVSEFVKRKKGEDAELEKLAAAHPGLVDLTVCGPQCPACANCMGELSCIVLSERVNETIDAPTGQPCPVMEGGK